MARAFGLSAAPKKNAITMVEIWRWIFAIGAAIAAFIATLYLNLIFLLFGPYPRDLAEPTAGLLMGSLVVLAGSFVAPRRQLATALILLISQFLLAVILLKFHWPSSLIGGVVAVGFVAWRFNPRRSQQATKWVRVAAGVVFLGFIGIVYAFYTDRPARPDALTPELREALGRSGADAVSFYRYDLGGFIDSEWLWRIDARPELVARVITAFGLQGTKKVPAAFWRMPPHYWPRTMTPSAAAFRSPQFSAVNRGPDGSHYFLLHDKAQNRAFVWVKDNF